MAEVSALTPSPPGLGTPHITSPLPHSTDPQPLPASPSDYTKQSSIPKAVLYSDPAVMESSVIETGVSGAPLVPPNGQGPPPVPPNTSLQSSGLDNTVDRPLLCSEVHKEGGAGAEVGTEVVPPPVQAQETDDTWEGRQAISFSQPVESEKRADEQGVSGKECPAPVHCPSPDLNPDFKANQNSAAITEPQLPTSPSPSASLPRHSQSSAGTVQATADMIVTPTSTQNSQCRRQDDGLQQNAHSQTKASPKPEFPSTPKKLEPPLTPKTQHSPPFSITQEPAAKLSLPNPAQRPAPDTLSYLESASLMSGTLESLSGLGEDGSSLGSDSEVSGLALRRTDKYGFLVGMQCSEGSGREVSVDVARQREMKWLDMFRNWDKWISRRFQKVKLRCRKGIPSSLRAKAWQLLSNSQELLEANPGKFEALEREQGEHKWLDIIEKDLHRQFPFHEMFASRGGHGQQDLYRILKAYTVYRPEEGYCQGQAPVAAVLLMHMPAEQAFWCLVQICEKYLPGYYSAGLEAIQLDGEIFFSLLRRVCPMAYRHLKKFKIDPILYMTEWFMCIFSRTLPWACVLRIWDMFFCEGVKVVFRVGLVLLKQMLGSVEKLRELQGMYETMERLRNIPQDSVQEDLLVQEVISLGVTEAIIERESAVQVRKWRESRGELTHQPGRRLHGSRAIYELKLRSASTRSRGSFSFLGAPAPSPGPLRASSSLLSLPGFRRPKALFLSQAKKGSFSGSSASVSPPPQDLQGQVASPALGQRPSSSSGPGTVGAASSGRNEASTSAVSRPPSVTPTPPHPLSPSPKISSEQCTTSKTPIANTTPLALDGGLGASRGEGEGKKLKRSKEEKKREKEEEKQRTREQKEREKAEKERQKKEKKKEKGGKKTDKGGGEAEEKNGSKAPRDAV
ncbi:hypothetical protein MATL_G00011970 [Megalops atlanticus]|uniref:Rab-GAP TBC domain-containing protein n=1 Tax=Megalops atlanticus TaxID=7932 RepID=A0A9D3QGC0_MEGAT|nr:hypothetical protein MATL_G00011970 [Megalops atlanticus]